MSQTDKIVKIESPDFNHLLALLETAAQRLEGFRNPRPREARATLQHAAQFLREHVIREESGGYVTAAESDIQKVVWALNYAAGYLDNLMSRQAEMTKRDIDAVIKLHLERIVKR